MNNTKPEFIIISNNCWGGEVYKDFKVPYNTPFIGLFIPPLCFAKLCTKLPDYLGKNLSFIPNSKYKTYEKFRVDHKYPIALLDDVEIHFQHYSTEDEVLDKWNRRLNRMPQDEKKWRIKGCDRELIYIDQFTNMWNEIPYQKIFFSAKNQRNIDSNVWIVDNFCRKEVVDGKALYNVSKNYVNVNKWLKDGTRSIPYWSLLKYSCKKLKNVLYNDRY